MKSLIKYFGGKNLMAKNILENFPDKEEYTMYIEPFGGSYGVGFQMEYVPPIEIYNDLDKNVYSLFKVLNNERLFSEFKRKCDLTYYSEDLRKEAKEKLKEELDVLDRAYYFFYANRTSHNGVGGLSVNTVVRRNMCKSVSDMLSCIDRLGDYHQRLSHLVVLNKDALSLIEHYKDSEYCFMYLDPPYVHSTRGSARYDVDMSDEQHQKFIDLCCSAKCKMLISGYDNEMYEKLLEHGFKKVSFDVNTVTGTRQPKTKTETLWKNY